MQKIDYNQYIAMLADRSRRREFRAYSIVIPGKGGFDFRVEPNPDLVTMTDDEYRFRSAITVGNDVERASRWLLFQLDRAFKPNKPVLVAEGDSWFQFPVLIDDVVEQLLDDYAIRSLAAAGDTAANMVHGDLEPKATEYLANLRAQKDHVQAFLFSAAGNDIIGENPETGDSELHGLLNDFDPNAGSVEAHINQSALNTRLGRLRACYEKVVTDIRAEPDLATLPILVHGYDYAFPYPAKANDPRDPPYAKRNEWLGEPLDKRGYPVTAEGDIRRRHDIIKYLIDRLYDMLNGLAGTSETSGIWVVNCRGAMPTVEDWNDEIHGTDDGFREVTARFRAKLDEARSVA